MKRGNEGDVDASFVFFIVVSFIVAVLLLWNSRAIAKDVCVVRLDDKTVAHVPVAPLGSVLNFPTKPANTLAGRNGVFGIEYVENDIAVSPLSASSRINLFVYLQGRRFTFDLAAKPGGCTLVLVRDPIEQKSKVEYKQK